MEDNVKKFLDRVVDMIVSETTIDYDKKVAYTSFLPHNSLMYDSIFKEHCINIYGLNDDEADYVWEEYRKIIKDKLGVKEKRYRSLSDLINDL